MRTFGWTEWARGLLSRFKRTARAPFVVAMPLVARRAPTCTLLQPVSVRLNWSWSSAAQPAAGALAPPAPGMVVKQQIIRERLLAGAETQPPAETPMVTHARRESREYSTTRLHTVSGSHTLLGATTREHAVCRGVDLLHIWETRRRVVLADPARAMAPHLRQVFARCEDRRPQGTPVLRTTRPAPPAAVQARASEPEVRAAERAAAIPAPPAQPPNVEWLASQVIQQIDRRLVAYRERMGRA